MIGGLHVSERRTGTHIHAALQLRRREIQHPVVDAALGSGLGSQRIYGLRRQVAEKPFGNHQAGIVAGGGEHHLPRGRLVQVRGHTLQPALRLLRGHDGGLVVEHGRKIDLDPAQRRRKVRAPGARVEPASDADHGLDRQRRHRMSDQIIQETTADTTPKHITSQPVALVRWPSRARRPGVRRKDRGPAHPDAPFPWRGRRRPSELYR